MLKKRFLRLLLLLSFGIGSVVSLYFVSDYKSHSRNSFLRVLPPHTLFGSDVKNLKIKCDYIIGTSGKYLFLGNNKIKNFVLRLDTNTFHDSTIMLAAPTGYKVLEDAELVIGQDNFILSDGMRGIVDDFPFGSNRLGKEIKTPFFTASIPLSGSAFLLRSLNAKRENTIIKFDTGNRSIISYDHFLKKQVDGFFCTDGLLFRNKDRIIYVYYYRNQFIVADANLNIKYVGKTIDTVSHAKIKIGKITSDNQVTLAAPPVFVNRKACANDKYLFINSALKADNEINDTHDNNAAIDVYDIPDGKYKFSFYLPYVNGYKVTDFKAYGNILYALTGPYLFQYHLHF